MTAVPIAGILFDIGGVLVALDGMPSLARLLGVEANHDALHGIWMASPSVVAHETGRIEEAEFASGVVADLNLPVTAGTFLDEFRSWPTGVLPGALELLEAIPRSYRVAALSNTSAIHWESIVAMGITGRFEQAYLSHQIGCLKPAADAFHIALKGMALSPSEVLFLDDGQRNVDAARELGLHAHLAKGPLDARRVLEQYDVIPSVAK